MATFPAPSDIQATYLQILKSIKPSLNINDKNSDFVMRGRAATGLISGLYGDQAKINSDTFITTARPEALILKGGDLGLTLNPATAASGTVSITGPNGTVVNAGDLTFIYNSTNLFYTNTTGGTIASGSLTLTIQSETTGSLTNIAYPDTLVLVSPPTGVSTSSGLVTSIGSGSDIESTDSFRARVLARQQNTPSGGNQSDYQAWGFLADPSVRSVSIRRFVRGLGTVGVVITSGVTDIDSAVTAGTAIVRIPSAQVIANVQSYYDANAPLTACTVVFGPSETPVNVSVAVDLIAPFIMSSVPTSPYNPLGLTINQLITREVGRALYNAAIGGRSLSGSPGGYIVASDIEASLDKWLGPNGFIKVLDDREVLPLNGTSYDLPISSNSLAAPGTVTIINGVP